MRTYFIVSIIAWLVKRFAPKDFHGVVDRAKANTAEAMKDGQMENYEVTEMIVTAVDDVAEMAARKNRGEK